LQSQQSNQSYAGDISPEKAWQALKEQSNACLIDVRTQAEWAFVGVPDLSGLGRQGIFVEWQVFPSMQINPSFLDAVEAEIRNQLVGDEQDIMHVPLYFLCRSGARSRSSAIAMAARGFGRSYNIADGFEGPLNAAGHRGKDRGWKAEGLPWRQG
jgi:rhodanese-related sulfurtransferase